MTVAVSAAIFDSSHRVQRPTLPQARLHPPRCPAVTTSSHRPHQRGGTLYVPHLAGMYAQVPGWISRDRWLLEVDCRLLAPAGEAVRTKHSVDRDTVRQVARALAAYADHDTGRSCAPSQQTIAKKLGCCDKTVQRAEKILEGLKLLVLVHGGGLYHGGMHKQYRELRKTGLRLTKAAFCPRIRALSLPSPVHNVQLPAGGLYRSKSFSTQYSPTDAQARRKAAPRPKSSAPTKDPGPKRLSTTADSRSARRTTTNTAVDRPIRPLALQQLAAALVNQLPKLARTRHIGAVCDALSWAEVEPTRWGSTPTRAAAHLITELHRSLPTRDLRSPIGWLHTALQKIDPAKPTPWELQQQAALRRQAADQAYAEQAAADAAAAVPLDESSAADQIRETLTKIRRLSRQRRRGPIRS